MAMHLVNGARLIAAALLLSACKDPVDQAAKKRIFSAEDPPQAVAAAAEKLAPEKVAESSELTRRVLGMGAGETTERIGAHSYRANVSWEWTAVGLPNVRLKETRELQSGRGGVSGDFHAKLFNDRDLGLEVMRVGGRVFARQTYGKDGAGKFRERKRDRGIAERLRDDTFGGVRDFDALFRGRLKLADQGTVTTDGRTAWKYAVSLADAAESKDLGLPPLAMPKKGVDETTARRMAFFELRQPRVLQGEVLIDQDTSVVLRARLDGRVGVEADGGVAELRLTLDSTLTPSAEPAFKVPPDFLPDEDKPEGIAAALKRFGIERTLPDGGVLKPAGGPDEPADEAE